MVEDKIALILKDIAKLKDDLKGVKKDMKQEEKIENDQYLELKKAYKDLRGQIKEMEEEHEDELKSDDFYNRLRELKMKKDEELAHSRENLQLSLAKLPIKALQMQMETENGRVNVQIQPEMKVYVNGREEK